MAWVLSDERRTGIDFRRHNPDRGTSLMVVSPDLTLRAESRSLTCFATAASMVPLEASRAALASLNRDASDANSTPESADCRQGKGNKVYRVSSGQTSDRHGQGLKQSGELLRYATTNNTLLYPELCPLEAALAWGSRQAVSLTLVLLQIIYQVSHIFHAFVPKNVGTVLQGLTVHHQPQADVYRRLQRFQHQGPILTPTTLGASAATTYDCTANNGAK